MEAVERIFADKTVYDPEGNPHPLGYNISLEEARELFALVTARKPATTLEVGFANGVSAITILSAKQGYDGGLHHVIDPFQSRYHYCGLAMVRRLGLAEKFQLYEQFPEEVIPTLGQVDFAFVDASHLFDLSLMEFVLIDKKLKVNGVMAFHDLWMPSLQKLLNYILTNRNYRLINGQSLDSKSLKRTLVRGLNKSKLLQKYLSPELLAPHYMSGIPNMVFLEKLAPDNREWTHHEIF